MRRAIADLIARGHQDAVRYGFNFFRLALGEEDASDKLAAQDEKLREWGVLDG